MDNCIECTSCGKEVSEEAGIEMESQIDKEIYFYCSEDCFFGHEADRFASMIDDAHERSKASQYA